MPDLSQTEAIRMKADLAEIVTSSVVYTVSTMFGHKIDVLRSESYEPAARAVTARVILFQDDNYAIFRFAFDRAMLMMLMSKFYPPEVLEAEKPFEDSACEIANIVCNRVKSYLNEQGFNLVMHLPSVERGKVDDKGKIVNLNFTLNQDRLHVDFALTDKKTANG